MNITECAFGAGLPLSRFEQVILGCSHALPTIVLAHILQINDQEILRIQKRLGLPVSFKESRRITSKFIASPPDLNQLPLTAEEMHEIRLYRLDWLQRRYDFDADDRLRKVIEVFAKTIPTEALAAVLQIDRGRVGEIKKELDIVQSRSELLKLAHDFASANKRPLAPELSKIERERLRNAWREAHRAYLKARRKRLKKSLESADELFKKLLRTRDEIREQNKTEEVVVESQCSGTCCEIWPRTKIFFTSNFRSQDKLSNRCVYCTFVSRTYAKFYGRRKNSRRGRILCNAEEAHIRPLVKVLTPIFPPTVIRRLFRISDGTLVRLRQVEGIRLSAKIVKQTLWRFIFRNSIPDLPQLTDAEYAQLQLIIVAVRREVMKSFERNLQVEKLLAAERERMWKDVLSGSVLRFFEQKCMLCMKSYPCTHSFFRKKENGTLSRTCRVCKNYVKKQRRLSKLRERFSI